MDSIRISIVQTDIVWENKQENLRLLHKKLQSLCGTTEIVVLPEMFSTGFSMQSKTLAEPNSGETITTLKLWARQFRIAICGSYIATDNRLFYNRAFVLTPEGELLTLKREELEMGYRTSLIARKGYLVLEAVLKLTRGNQEQIKEKMADLRQRRISKQPLEYPSAGSTFKRCLLYTSPSPRD